VAPDLARETNARIWAVIIDKENGNINLQVHLKELSSRYFGNLMFSAPDHDEMITEQTQEL